MSTVADEVAEIMDRVKLWPSPTRIALAKQILDSLAVADATDPSAPPPPARPLRGVPVAEVAGMFRGNGPALTDEECRQIVEEERWLKYGS